MRLGQSANTGVSLITTFVSTSEDTVLMAALFVVINQRIVLGRLRYSMSVLIFIVTVYALSSTSALAQVNKLLRPQNYYFILFPLK